MMWFLSSPWTSILCKLVTLKLTIQFQIPFGFLKCIRKEKSTFQFTYLIILYCFICLNSWSCLPNPPGFFLAIFRYSWYRIFLGITHLFLSNRFPLVLYKSLFVFKWSQRIFAWYMFFSIFITLLSKELVIYFKMLPVSLIPNSKLTDWKKFFITNT